MAKIIPDRIPSRASQGERDTFELLQKLPDNYWVYYEPNINKQIPDFIVIAPDLGVIIIEVKGWRLKNIREADNNDVRVNFDNGDEIHEHPLRQALRYQWRLYGVCRNDPRGSSLLHREGKHKNKVVFPFCHFVILSNITQDNIESLEGSNLYDIFRPENTLFRNQLLKLKGSSPEKIRSKFLEFFNHFWNVDLTDEQVNVLRSLIHPQIVIEDSIAESLNAKEQDEVKKILVLDHRQEKNASRIGDGHRIVYGVAGSGKTILLIARSKILFDRNHEAKILLLCYNVSLCAYLRGSLKKYPKINVFHFDGWAKHNNVTRRRRDPNTSESEKDESLGKRLLDHLQHQHGDYRTYDAILIDEAQDFPAVWFSCVLEALKDPNIGDLLIVCDGNQGIRPVGSLSWKAIGIQAKGRTIHQAYDLDRSYRNTLGILKLASHFTAKNVKNDEDTICTVAVNPTHTTRMGSQPILFSCKDPIDEFKRIIFIVKRLLDGKVSLNGKPVIINPHEIGILYPKLLKKETNDFHTFIAELSQVCPITWLNESPQSRTKIFEPSLKIQTVHSSKGLQYRAVFVMRADLFEPYTPEDHDTEQSLLFVALTRAMEFLFVTYSKENEFIEGMIKSGDAICK